jgi:hypothetical protein
MNLIAFIAIAWDNLGGNDPEVAMTVCLWTAKITAWIV